MHCSDTRYFRSSMQKHNHKAHHTTRDCGAQYPTLVLRKLAMRSDECFTLRVITRVLLPDLQNHQTKGEEVNISGLI